MINEARHREPAAILCADWGKESQKRAVYVADVTAQVVRRVSATGWSVVRVLEEAKRWTATGAVLAPFDAPLGVPASYFAAFGRHHAPPPANFLDLLARARSLPHFSDATAVASDWTVERPFFGVPPGDGGLGSYVNAAARVDVDLYRGIDKMTGAKALFIKSGIPGSVGSATCALWQELAPLLTAERSFAVWPFEGELSALLRATPIVVGEIYPRAAYATALLDAPPASRPPLVVAKTDARVRCEAIAVLRRAGWARRLGVSFENLAEAEANEDDFDACLTAAALLRCVLEGAPLCPPHVHSAAIEGGMLGTGSVDLRLPSQTFATPGRERSQARPMVRRAWHPREPGLESAGATGSDPRAGAKVFPCPIAGCAKVFRGSRGGWDAHVGSPRLHPHWHPELRAAEDRKRRFETEFPGFFGWRRRVSSAERAPGRKSEDRMPTDAEHRFHEAMLAIYRRAKAEANYNATRFLGMVVERGGLETARYLLRAPTISEAYAALWERKRLDLTVEALILQPEWKMLFTDVERHIATSRLREYGYTGPLTDTRD